MEDIGWSLLFRPWLQYHLFSLWLLMYLGLGEGSAKASNWLCKLWIFPLRTPLSIRLFFLNKQSNVNELLNVCYNAQVSQVSQLDDSHYII